MPYCTQCGTQVGAADRFCARCGKLQSAGPAASSGPASGSSAQSTYAPFSDPVSHLTAVDTRTASVLCYIPVIGWIMCIVVLASVKYRDDFETRFNAFQGLYLFVAWLIADWVLSPMTAGASHSLHLVPLLKAVLIGTWIFMLIKVSHREHFKLPVIGDLAEKSVSEQRV